MKTNYLKLGMIAALMLSVSIGYAQEITTDITKQAGTTLGGATTPTAATAGANAFTAPTSGVPTDAGHVRVIDNKGTIKFLQVANGLTQLTNTAPNGGVVTTWQLGGQLVSNTEIDFNGNVFSFNNVLQVDTSDTTNGVPATTFTTAKGAGNSGWALLVRDESTGEVKKLAAADLIVSGQTMFTVGANGDTAFVVTAGTPALAGAQIPLPNFSKVWVYRNGAKLIANLDYTIAGSTVTLVPNTNTATNQDFTTYAGDIIEVQYVK